MFPPALDQLGYQDLFQVESEVLEVTMIDEMRYARELPQEFRNCLVPEPFGIYPKGDSFPIVTFKDSPSYLYGVRGEFYPAEQLVSLGPEILKETISEMKVDPHHPNDPNGSTRVIHRPRPKLERMLALNSSGYYSAALYVMSCVYEYLNDLNPFKNVFTLHHSLLCKKESWIEQQHHEYVESIPLVTISNLKHELAKFVGRDHWNKYHIKLQPRLSVVEKMNDVRVIEYYRNIFEELDEKHRQEHGF